MTQILEIGSFIDINNFWATRLTKFLIVTTTVRQLGQIVNKGLID